MDSQPAPSPSSRPPYFTAGLLLTIALALAVSPAHAAPPGGTPISRAPGAQLHPACASDGGAGMVVAWLDQRRGVTDVYAHHVLSSGDPDPSWPADGTVVAEGGSPGALSLHADGAGGVHVVWYDASANAVLAQHLTASGSRDPAWPANGRVLVAAPIGGPSGVIVRVASDAPGSIYVCWNRFDFTTEPLQIQRFDADGAPRWASPRLIANAGLGGSRFTAVHLGASANGSTVAWSLFEDLFIGSYAPAIATQTLPDGTPGYLTDLATPYGGSISVGARVDQLAVDASGAAFVQLQVGSANVLQRLSSAGGFEWPLDRSISSRGRLVPDGTGGVFGLGASGVALDRRDGDGLVPAGWSGAGLVIQNAATFDVVAPALHPDGILLVWSDRVTGKAADVIAIVVTREGSAAPGWSPSGDPVASVRGDQVTPCVMVGPGGLALSAWTDLRRSSGDLYAGVVFAPPGKGPNRAAPDEVADDPPATLPSVARTPDREAQLAPGARISHAPMLRVEREAGSAFAHVSYAPVRDGDVVLEMLDAAGRRIDRQAASVTAGASQTFSIGLRALPAGLYWFRARQGGDAISARFVKLD